ncbi:beta-galactosidase [Paenibacillus sp. 19GGS1-52]|uniref:beta-galactosidase n=1 Tax=Paenibacillus sp. 19GGS1-52 TaxID=2758563 RepID=UPI001EFBA1E9|nr:beta-galactosidase [Paenibacillus sp. 19GGS1-52]ULO04922.1 beta-galactosidase [Paenibacillus sp. 19GGS1-52]
MKSAQRIIFYDPTFPGSLHPEAVEGLSGQLAEQADPGENGTLSIWADAEMLAASLEQAGSGDCLLYLHAPFFPKAAWIAILAFLRRGGGLVSIGGAPFKRPVQKLDGRWHIEAEQTAFHQQIHIHEALLVNGRYTADCLASEELPFCSGQQTLWNNCEAWNLVPHVTRASDLPEQMGSAGPMDTVIKSLIMGTNSEGSPVSAPVVLWEHMRGEFQGGRWILAGRPQDKSLEQQEWREALLSWTAFAARGATELWIKPNYASYETDDQAVLTMHTQRIGGSAGRTTLEEWKIELEVEAQDGQGPGYSTSLNTEVTYELNLIRIRVPLALKPGLYSVRCRAVSPEGEVHVLRQGFWGHDEALLCKGEFVMCGRDYFTRNGSTLPVVGTTYMASDVSRKFLFLPNVDLWNRDMQAIAASGMNWLRTGIWTAYRHIMQIDGHASEEVLRAIDAFLMTAKRHGLQTTFTFFSFTPETWEGSNPYLDPRSIEAQKRFIRSIVSRHRLTSYVDWDLINEPSMFDPRRIFASGPRSAQDPYEAKAFQEWLLRRHGNMECLQEVWGMPASVLPAIGSVQLPEPEHINFEIAEIQESKHSSPWLDYCLFSMDMLAAWAKEMVQTIKQLAPRQIVTVGQDEALGAQRPSPFFYQEAVDYTTIHPWWLNDALLWSGIFAKTADKPNLAQEVGIMYVETPDGRAKRSEEELAALLERKFAYSFATGGAGAIQWIWNTNYYMNNTNESHIGALRADGTQKPEAGILQDFAQFMQRISHLMGDRELEQTAIVFPYSNDFSNRKLAYDATTVLSRLLGYRLRLPFRAASEYHLDDLVRNPAQLILLPSPHSLANEAFEQLIAIAEQQGSVLVVTGPLQLDEYWRPGGRLKRLLGQTELRNVRREEFLRLGEERFSVSFSGTRIAELWKEIITVVTEDGALSANVLPVNHFDVGYRGPGDAPVHLALGRGKLIWCPLPLELNDREEPLLAFYNMAAEIAGIMPELEWKIGGEIPGIYGRKLGYANGALFIFVSEYAWECPIEVRDPRNGTSYRFLLGAERSILFATDPLGTLLETYRPKETEIIVF